MITRAGDIKEIEMNLFSRSHFGRGFSREDPAVRMVLPQSSGNCEILYKDFFKCRTISIGTCSVLLVLSRQFGVPKTIQGWHSDRRTGICLSDRLDVPGSTVQTINNPFLDSTIHLTFSAEMLGYGRSFNSMTSSSDMSLY